MLRLPKFPAVVGGRGTDREPVVPFCGPRELLNPGPRFAAPSVGRCVPPACPGLDRLLAFAPRAPELNEPRLPADEADRLTTGRANARCGGTAALAPLEPSMLARVGATTGE